MTDFTTRTDAADGVSNALGLAGNALGLAARMGARVAGRAGRHAVDRLLGPDLERKATELDFAVASRIDRVRAALLARERMRDLADRLQGQLTALDAVRKDLPEPAAEELTAEKGQLAWLLGELRRAM
ncbi:hypothetical protein ACPZ19_46205 [Amycolatopsis lurida]